MKKHITFFLLVANCFTLKASWDTMINKEVNIEGQVYSKYRRLNYVYNATEIAAGINPADPRGENPLNPNYAVLVDSIRSGEPISIFASADAIDYDISVFDYDDTGTETREARWLSLKNSSPIMKGSTKYRVNTSVQKDYTVSLSLHHPYPLYGDTVKVILGNNTLTLDFSPAY